MSPHSVQALCIFGKASYLAYGRVLSLAQKMARNGARALNFFGQSDFLCLSGPVSTAGPSATSDFAQALEQILSARARLRNSIATRPLRSTEECS